MSQDVVDLLQQLVRIPSVNPDNAPGTSHTGEETLAVFLSGWLESIGAKVTLEEIRPGRPNLIARFAPRDGRPRILLGPHLDTVGVFLAAGADVNARSKAGFTPILFAVRQGSTEAVRSLIKAKANVNDVAQAAAISSNSTAKPVTDATSALAMAVINAHFEIASLLLENGADPNAPDARGSILHALTWIRRPGTYAARRHARVA